MEIKLRPALKKTALHSYGIVELCTRSAKGSSWTSPFGDFFSGLRSNRAEQKRVRRDLEKLARYGKTVFHYTNQARDVGPTREMLELKPGGQRILLFRDGDNWIIVDAFKKPPRKMQDQKIQAADRVREMYLAAS